MMPKLRYKLFRGALIKWRIKGELSSMASSASSAGTRGTGPPGGGYGFQSAAQPSRIAMLGGHQKMRLR